MYDGLAVCNWWDFFQSRNYSTKTDLGSVIVFSARGKSLGVPKSVGSWKMLKVFVLAQFYGLLSKHLRYLALQ